MAINKRIELTWHGEKYAVLVTMATIERIEEHLNLATMVRDCSNGDMKSSKAARLVATLLNEAGADVTVDDVFEGMFGGEISTPASVMVMVTVILGAIFPAPKKKPTQSKKQSKDKN